MDNKGQVSTEYLIMLTLFLLIAALVGTIILGTGGLSMGISQNNILYRDSVKAMLE